MSHISFCGASPLLAKHCFPFSKGSNVFMWYAVFCLWKIEEAPQGVVFLFCWTWCHFKRGLQPPDVVSTTERSMNKLRLRLWKLNVGCWHHKTPECACCERWLLSASVFSGRKSAEMTLRLKTRENQRVFVCRELSTDVILHPYYPECYWGWDKVTSWLLFVFHVPSFPATQKTGNPYYMSTNTHFQQFLFIYSISFESLAALYLKLANTSFLVAKRRSPPLVKCSVFLLQPWLF